jgi:dCMP deaminase
MRPTKDVYFMGITRAVSTRSTCLSRQVGAIFVRDERIVSTGYNGSPPGLPHCTEFGCLMEAGRCVRTIHAEQNAIIQAALHGVTTQGSTLYTTHRPCLVCAMMVAAAGVVRVVYAAGDMSGREAYILLDSGIQAVLVPFDTFVEGAQI